MAVPAGVAVGAPAGMRTFSDIQADHSIAVTFGVRLVGHLLVYPRYSAYGGQMSNSYILTSKGLEVLANGYLSG